MTTTARTRWLLLLIAFVFIGLLAGGTWFYREQGQYVRREVEQELNTIAKLKVNEIVRWRRERIADAMILLKSPYFVAGAKRYLSEPSPEDAEFMLPRFQSLCDHNGYRDVLLVTLGGDIHLSRSGVTDRLHDYVLSVLPQVQQAGVPALVDLHEEGVVPVPHLSVVSPINNHGAVVLVCDATDFLYPLINLWPKPSKSAETLLVRREGEHVLFLNNLRHQSNTALKLSIPLTQTNVPAVMAVMGQEGVVYGADYRGIEVVSVLKPVPGSPWFMVSKMDVEEAFAGWRFRAILILSLMLTGLLAMTAVAAVVWHQNEAARFSALLREEKSRHETEERYRVTLMSVGDGVIVTDVEGRVRLMNPVAEELTGWSAKEARGESLEKIFNIVNEETRKPVENPVDRVVQEGVVIGLANHTVLIARDGTERAIADSGAPIRGDGGELVGVVLVFRDQTAERSVERAVEVERNNIKAIMAASPVGLLVLDDKECITDANPAAERVLGRKLADLKNRRCGDFIACPHRHDDPRGCGNTPECPTCPLLSAIRETLSTGRGVFDREAEVQAETAGEASRWLRFSVEVVTLSGKPHAVMALDDITAAKRASEDVKMLLDQGEKDRMALLGILEDQQRARSALQESERQLKRAQQIARMGNWSWDIKGRKLAWSDELRQIWGVADDFPLTEESLNAFIHPDDREKNAHEVWAFLKEKSVLDFEFRIIRSDGETRHLHQVAELMRDPDGQPLRAFGVIQDVTEQRKTDAAVREQLDELRRWHKAMQGREARVIELKREVNELLVKLGEPAKYTSADVPREGAS
jgi:PAS domain S-box-containing protein